MKISDMIAMCMRNLFRRKLRTFLTVLGVIIGTCSIVVMVSLGVGMKHSLDESLSMMGDLTLININNYGGGGGRPGMMGGGGNTDGGATPLDDEMIETIRNHPDVVAVTPIYRFREWGAFQMSSGRYKNDGGELIGVDMASLADFGHTLEKGSFPPPEDAANYIMMGSNVPYDFYDSKRKNNNRVNAWELVNGEKPDPFFDVMTDRIKYQLVATTAKGDTKRKDLRVAGVSGIFAEDWEHNGEFMYATVADISFVKNLEQQYYRMAGKKPPNQGGKTNYESVKVKVSSMDKVKEVQEFIDGYGYETWSMESMRAPMEKTYSTIQMVLGGIGAISLLVAALGITNTMIMSIYERTREIGIMKVLGCYISNIRTSFLMEAGTIGFMGGIIGLILSYTLSFLLNTFVGGGLLGGMMGGGGRISIIPPWLALFGLGFSTAVGLISGFSPANRAVKISALEAIKHE